MKYEIANHRGNIDFTIEVPDWVPAKAKTFANKAAAQDWNDGVDYRSVLELLNKRTEDCPRWYQVVHEEVLDGLMSWIQENDTPNEDGESCGEYFAYGYCSGDPTDFQRLLVDAVATIGGHNAWLPR